MDLNPKRIDILESKHLAIHAWLKRAGNELSKNKEKEYLEAVKRIAHIADELLLMAQTNDEKGKQLGWWK